MDEEGFKTFINRVGMYRQFDEARQNDLERICSEYSELARKVDILAKDLDDEKRNRHHWRDRAEQAELSLNKSPYAVVLIDGDGYFFNREFYNTQVEAGGARAGNALLNDVQYFLKSNELLDQPGEIDILATIYCNQQVPAMNLVNADYLQHPSQLQSFFWSFISSNSFFQVVDCGPGKERTDAKLRDVYRFHLTKAQCKYIFLACCHDNGYITELDKYCHDPISANKTILIRHGNTAAGYARKGLKFANFSSTFEMEPLQRVQRRIEQTSIVPRAAPQAPSADDGTSSNEADVTNDTTPGTTWSTVTANAHPSSRSKSFTATTAETNDIPKISQTATGDTKTGIPVNRFNQRIDKRIPNPLSSEIERFEIRIAARRLCNTEHLTSAGCYAYNCKYDHDPIDEKMRQTLKYKARSIPCTVGSGCRRKDCFYGHQCPWGADRCTNSKCNFWRNGLHEISDLEIVKFVPATD